MTLESSWPLEEIFVPYGEEKEGSMVTDIQDRISPKSWSFVETYGYKKSENVVPKSAIK